MLFLVQPDKVAAQDMFTGESGSPGFTYDEIQVFLKMVIRVFLQKEN